MSLMERVSAFRLSLAKRSLEAELNKSIELMNGHKEAGLPAGHKYYKVLYDRACKAIVKYQAAQTNLGEPASDFEEIAVSVPTLKELDNLATGQEAGGVQQKAGLATAGILVGSVVFTIIWAINHDLYLFLTHWPNLHWAVR